MSVVSEVKELVSTLATVYSKFQSAKKSNQGDCPSFSHVSLIILFHQSAKNSGKPHLFDENPWRHFVEQA